MLSLLAGYIEAATINAGSCSASDIQSAIDASTNGDTVMVPAGNCAWSTPVKISKGIILKGAGHDRTIITPNTPSDWNGWPIGITSPAGQTVGVKDMAFVGGSYGYDHGIINVGGSSKPVIISGVRFENIKSRAMRTRGDTAGVFANSIVISGGAKIIISSEGYGGEGYGDGSWKAPLSFGDLSSSWTIEDNYFEGTDSSHMYSACDSEAGARVIFRKNELKNAFFINHGAETAGRQRGGRSWIFYGNDISCTWGSVCFAVTQMRAGTGLVYDNTIIGAGYEKQFQLYVKRAGESFAPWGLCDGSSPYDGNLGLPGAPGYPCRDQTGTSTDTGVMTPQELIPCYEWRNTIQGSDADFTAGTAYMVEGRDYFNDVPIGADASKPSSCIKNQGYFATDTRVLYKCGALSNWQVHYTEPAYPHPLLSGGSVPQASECDDGMDNDGDGKMDLADSGCGSSADADESDCGDGKCEGVETCSSCQSDCGACCTDTCASLGKQCGTWILCGASTNCGTCSSGACDSQGKCIVQSGNLIENGDFESGFTNGVANSWQISSDGSIRYIASEDVGHSGKAQKIQVTAKGSWGLNIFQMPQLVVGKQYDLTFWYRSEMPVNAEVIDGQGSNIVVRQVLTSSNTWKRMNIRFNYTSTAANQLRFLTSSVGSVWIDDVGLFEVTCAPADSDCDGCIRQDELLDYVTKWKSGQVTLANLMEAIGQWKKGC